MISDPLVLLRHLDVALVLMAAPFVLAAGLPALGYGVGATAWIVQRLGSDALDSYARREDDVRRQAGITIAGALVRAWLVGLAILAVGLAGDREDGAMAAALVLIAFTVYLGVALLARRFEGSA